MIQDLALKKDELAAPKTVYNKKKNTTKTTTTTNSQLTRDNSTFLK